MALYAIADLHLSFGCNKPMDVFPGWKRYTARLEENWRGLVGEEDTVVVAGDISWAMSLQEARADFAFLHSLPGRKLILKGNHDYWWSTRRKIDAFLEQNGFSSIRVLHNNAYTVEGYAVCGTRGWVYNAATPEDKKIVNREVGRLNASLDAAEPGKEPVVFLHYPPQYDDMSCREIMQVLESRGVAKCYFGHIHGAEAAARVLSGVRNGVSYTLIAGDHLRFRPLEVR